MGQWGGKRHGSGRKRIPVELHVLRGTYRRDRHAPLPDSAATDDGLDARAKWGGLVDDLEPLNADELVTWKERERARPTWVPQRALHFFWRHVDPVHGGGEWSWPGFAAALEHDRAEVLAVSNEHQTQAARLQKWLKDVEKLGQRRDGDPDARSNGIGIYYELAIGLGYDGTAHDGGH